MAPVPPPISSTSPVPRRAGAAGRRATRPSRSWPSGGRRSGRRIWFAYSWRQRKEARRLAHEANTLSSPLPLPGRRRLNLPGGRVRRHTGRPAGIAGRGSVARRGSRIRPADGARSAPVPDRLRLAEHAGSTSRTGRRSTTPRCWLTSGVTPTRMSRRSGSATTSRSSPASTHTSWAACAARWPPCGWSARAIRRCIGSGSGWSSPSPGIASSTA